MSAMPEALLWDFGDTLVDERWMRRCPQAWPGWEEAWVAVMAEMADEWNVGAVSSYEVFAALSDRVGMTLQDVEAHARACCDRIVFNATAWRVASERRFPQALVTVNPDLFTDYVVPSYALGDVFDVIVASYAENTADKSALCRAALDRLEFRGDRSSALLIDNRSDLVDAWRDIGGAGYWFQSDEQFSRDVVSLLAVHRESV
jgi:phosphoglycolate phosphatase-like HAD superfamily hydrolase